MGNVDLRRKSNFLVVTESKLPVITMMFHMKNTDPVSENFDWVRIIAETSVKAIEDAFKEFTNREDIAIVMINQYVSVAELLAWIFCMAPLSMC